MLKEQKNMKSIYEYISSLPVFSDHEHHQTDEFFAQGMSLDKALKNSYVSWTGYVPDGTVKSRKALLDNVLFNSYFTWFEKGLQKVHNIDEDITLETWDYISDKIKVAYERDLNFHWNTLIENGYEKLVQDSFWNPGSDEGHDDVFIPAFRIDKFMYGYHSESIAPNNFIPWSRYGFVGGSLNDYVEMMNDIIKIQHSKGKVAAFKCAEAYNRSINFLPDDYELANKIFGIHPNDISPEQKIIFGNYIFNRCCELAAELDVPFQIHTGLARLSGSQPMMFEPIIEKHKKTKFVLFHSGFPWTHEVAGLAHNHTNVLPSLTWTATICTSSAVRALHDYIEVTSSIDKITWGSDCWVAEESVGAMLAWRYIVSKVLSERFTEGLIKAGQVEILAEKLMFRNGRKIYLH